MPVVCTILKSVSFRFQSHVTHVPQHALISMYVTRSNIKLHSKVEATVARAICHRMVS